MLPRRNRRGPLRFTPGDYFVANHSDVLIQAAARGHFLAAVLRMCRRTILPALVREVLPSFQAVRQQAEAAGLDAVKDILYAMGHPR
jgi:hypothetical protein